MTNIKHLFFAIILLTLAWFVGIVLTQQRIQFEAESIRSAQISNQSPFVWNFDDSKQDIIDSFLSYWQNTNSSILADQHSNPKLSLNLSGFVINSLQHDQLLITSKDVLHGFVNIEFKTNLNDDFYYYSPRIQIQGKSQVIDLNTTWRGINQDKSQTIKAPWGTASQKVSSIVLHFENPWKDLQIDSISLPYSHSKINHEFIGVNCDGIINADFKVSQLSFNQFELNEFCLYSSNYMWLKQQLNQQYPGSTLSIMKKSSWTSISPYLINTPFTSIYSINTILYLTLSLILIIVYKIRNSFKTIAKTEEAWYKWLVKKILMQKILPYHFLLSYAVILTPTLILLIIMAFIKTPTLEVLQGFSMYFLWAVVQQYILGYVLADRIFNHRIQNKFISAMLAGLVFALFHLPSTTLMFATFIGGSCWALSWLWFKRFIPLALSHTLLALMFYYVVPNQYLYSAKVLQWFWK